MDLARFTTAIETTIPVVNGWGQVNSRKLWLADLPDGWYHLRLDSNVEMLGKATLMDIHEALRDKKFLRVYALGTEGIPINFNNLFERGQNEAIKVNFLDLDVFEVARVYQAEDKRFYFVEEDVSFNRQLLLQMKERFNHELSIDGLGGITPELRYYFLLLNLQRQSYREFEELEKLKLSEAEKAKRVKEFQSTFSGRLQTVVEKAGGSLVKFSKSGRGYLVEWKVDGQTLKSTIRDDMGIINLGFCASGQDNLHSLSSAVQLAKLYQENDELNITRH